MRSIRQYDHPRLELHECLLLFSVSIDESLQCSRHYRAVVEVGHALYLVARVEYLRAQLCVSLFDFFLENFFDVMEQMVSCVVHEHTDDGERAVLLAKHLGHFKDFILVGVQLLETVERLLTF